MRNNILFITPDDLFQQIEKIVTKNPDRLRAFNYHELPNGREAFTEDQILDPKTCHCLAGFIIALTPQAAKYSYMWTVGANDQTLETVNRILVDNGRKPIPMAIFFSDEESMLKVIRMRAAEERVEEARNPKHLYN